MMDVPVLVPVPTVLVFWGIYDNLTYVGTGQIEFSRLIIRQATEAEE